MISDPWFWVIGTIAVTLIGLAKGGFSGVGTLSTPLLALVLAPVQASAVILPILLAQDVVALWAFRKTWDRHAVAVLLPGAVIGIGLGYLFAANLTERWVTGILGVISLVFALSRLWAERGGLVAAKRLPDWVGFICGIGSGFTGQIAHAGAPPFQIWILPRRLPRDEFAGTAVVFFAACNWLKVPAFVALGQFTPANLLLSASLIPIALLATWAGIRMVRLIPMERFYTAIYVLFAIVGVKLLWSALFSTS